MNKKKFERLIITVVTIVSILYAILRYNMAGDVPWKDLPIYVLNKGLSLASLILLVINFSLRPLRNRGVKISQNLLDARRVIGRSGFLLAAIHVIMSMIVLNPKYYHVFFLEDTTLSIRGGMSLLGGVLSFVFLWIYNISFKPNKNDEDKQKSAIASREFFLYAMLFTGVHLFFMGYSGWLTPSKWQANLPPISLISFVTFFIGYLINLIFGKK